MRPHAAARDSRNRNANRPAKPATNAPEAPANATLLKRRMRRTALLGNIVIMPSTGRLVTALSERESWNVGSISLAANAAARPTSTDAAKASAISTRRFGNTGCGDTRGGSITLKRVPPASATPSPSDADSRRASSAS